LTAAANEGALDVVRALLELGADVSVTGMFGETGLHTACWYGYLDIAELLLRHGSPVDARESEFGAHVERGRPSPELDAASPPLSPGCGFTGTISPTLGHRDSASI